MKNESEIEPVVGCPTISHIYQRVKEDYYDEDDYEEDYGEDFDFIREYFDDDDYEYVIDEIYC